MRSPIITLGIVLAGACAVAYAAWPKPELTRRNVTHRLARHRREPPLPAATGAALALDPLRRGTWVVDEENDALLLVADDGEVKSLPVDAWPQQVVVDRAGVAWVTCRQAGTLVRVELGAPPQRV